MTIPALAPLFVGDFAHYREMLVLPGQDERTGVRMRDLTTSDGVAWLLDEYRQCQPGEDPRALLSQWSRFYFLRLTIPVVAANLILGRELCVDLDSVEVILGNDGTPEAFRLPDEGHGFPVPPADGFARFRVLLEDNFAPLIQGWCQQVKVSPKVMWSNAANYFEWLIGVLESFGLPGVPYADGRQIVEAPRYPDGRRNFMADPVRYVERTRGQPPLRQRRQCCIRYRLPDMPLCSNCPHIDRPPKGALLPVDE